MNPMAIPSKTSQSARRYWLWLVLAGFLWLQFAGIVHRHLHSDKLAPLASAVSVDQLEKLLPEHSQQNKSDCQLLDLQCFGMALSSPAPVIDALDLHTAFERLRFLSLSPRPSQDYQARAPPQTLI